MHFEHGDSSLIKVASTSYFAAMSCFIARLDFTYADSTLIAPLQHLLSAIAAIVAIVVGLPAAYKVVVNVYSTIKKFISKWKN